MCIFCQIAAGTAPGSFIYRDDHVIAIMDIAQATRGHVLVIPVEHAESLHDLSPESAAQAVQLAQRISAAVMASPLRPVGYNLIQNNGAQANQSVFHVHFHIIPRYGEPFSDLLGHHGRMVDHGELEDLAAVIRAHLA